MTPSPAGDPRQIEIPDFCLVVLIGSTGAGKSSFAARHFRPTEVIGSDWARGRVADDETDQSATADAFALVQFMAALRLKNRRLAVIDATNVRREDRRQWVELATSHHALPVAVVLDPGEEVCVARNAERSDRPSGSGVVRRMRREIEQGLRGLAREGFRVVHQTDGIEPLAVRRAPLWTDRRDHAGPFDIIGDVHGCCDELEALLARLGYVVTWKGEGGERAAEVAAPHGRTAVFVGDLVDRGPRTPDVIRLVAAMEAAGIGLCVMGNHDQKLARALDTRSRDQVTVAHGLQQSLDQMAQEAPAFVHWAQGWLRDLRSHYWLDGGRLAVAHAGIRETMIGRGSGAVRSFTMYGETTGELDGFGLPVRLDWARDYRGATAVVYGHVPMARAEWVNNTIDIDTGCVFGGALTALRWPEREIVSVPAARTYAAPIKPLGGAEASVSAQAAADALPDLADVTGVRHIGTILHGRIRIDAERSAAALEVASRFALPPQWLCYLPPTMSPVATSPLEGWLERPEEAFAFFRDRGVLDLVVEEKHMGSRALIALCRDGTAAARRFGQPEGAARQGRIWTRTGRAFLDDAREAALLARLGQAAEAAGLWSELGSEWALLDAEIMPWSAKAGPLIEAQYAPVGEAARLGLSLVGETMARVAARIPDAAPLAALFAGRRDRAARYDAAWRGYVWDTPRPEDLRVAPFHVLASEGAVHMDRPHDWHMGWNARLAGTGEPVLQATEWHRLDLSDAAACREVVAWWEARTAAGGEGMVVKPRGFTVHDRKGRLVQPALKVRGRDYLRIIYGPDYDTPENLVRLKERALDRKRSLALSEYALGHEALARFVAGEPLRRWHDCILATLALESEPIDPRL